MRKLKKLGAMLLSLVLATTSITIVPKQDNVVNAASSVITESDFLKANGKVLKNNYGNGDTVYLRGVNAGAYTIQEFWMSPTSYTANCTDQQDIWRILTDRFGAEKAKTLIDAYEDNYWTEADFDRIASLGMNCIRLPLWYRNFVDENNNWYSDAFERVDWFVKEAGERGMYVVIDMHGAYGSQNGSDHSGIDGGNAKEAASEFFFGSNAAANQEKYYQMWEKLAEHFKGNPTVAGYDLLNEPYCTYRYNSSYSEEYLHSLLWGIYDKAYDRIRAIDSEHLIIMEATWDGWDLPNPNDYGWSNVMYEYHNYLYDDYDNVNGQQVANMQTKLNNIFCMNYDVPSYMGEFNYFNNLDAWRQGLQLLNDNGLSWTIWSYKCTAENGNWGLVNQSIGKVNVETDSYETILSIWSNSGSGYENTGLMDVVKNYTPGTVRPTQYTTVANGTYYLECNGNIVCADNYGDNPLIANRDSFSGSWETLHIVNNADGTISFKSDVNGKYVCAVIDDKGQLIARSDVIDAWEKFRLVNIHSNQYAIQSVANGKYVTADFNDTENNGQLKAMSDSIGGAWEAFYFYGLEVDETQAPTTTTQAPTTTASNVPEGFTTVSANTWTQAGNWGCYFGDWSGKAEGAYRLSGDTYQLYLISANTGVDWLAQTSYKTAVTAGRKYRVTVSITSDKAGSIGIKENISNKDTEQVYKDISAGTTEITAEYTVTANEIEVMFELGRGISQGTTLTFNSVRIEDITEVPTTTTTQAPTTTTPPTTTEAPQTGGPIEVIGVVSSCRSDNTITVVWGQNDSHISSGQKYNVYVDGELKLREMTCGEYTISGIAKGNHTVKVTAVLNGIESAGMSVDVTVTGANEITTEAPTEEPTTEAPTEAPTIRGGIEINGYQVNTNSEGMRTIYSVEEKINGLEVVASGMVYALGDYASKEEMCVGSSSEYVADFESTIKGLCDVNFSNSITGRSYAMTMKFAAKTKMEFNAKWYIRAYAKLSDGSYVYTDVVEYTIYDIANELYQGKKFNNRTAHDYLYTDILITVKPDYAKIEFDISNSIVR